MSVPTQTTANKSCDVLVGRANTEDLIGFKLGGVDVFVGTGSPNAEVTAAKGSLFIEVGAPNLYQNTDGAKAWELVGGQT